MVNDKAFLILVKISLVDNDNNPADGQLFDYGTDTFDINYNKKMKIHYLIFILQL